MKQTSTQSAASRNALYVARRVDTRLTQFLAGTGWEIERAGTPVLADKLAERSKYAVGLIDLRDGYTPQQLSALEPLLTRNTTSWIALVAPGQVEDADARRLILDYCFDYMTAPFVEERVNHALGHASGLHMLRETHEGPPRAAGSHQMIGRCNAMLQLYRSITKYAGSEAPVFIYGESGTGKELTASAIHQESLRRKGAFVAINCAAIPPTLLQSELFGYERGAFTGANQRKIGRIEQAHGGTLFLDEIGDMPVECQAILLRFLQEGTFERLGGRAPVRVDARIVSATHVDLVLAVSEGRFRTDLYHRLCVLQLNEPPLRERGDDIRLLAMHLLQVYNKDSSRKFRGFSSDAISAMYNYTWPGNVRELLNHVRRAIVMAEGRVINADDLGLPAGGERPVPTLADIRLEADRTAVTEALQRHSYNMSGAAHDLDVSRATLYRMMRACGLRAEYDAERLGLSHVVSDTEPRASRPHRNGLFR
jgi:DNA-binding NtrC family response regulator